MIRQARKLSQGYYLTYQEQIPTAQLVQRVANVMQEYTQIGQVFKSTMYSSGVRFVETNCTENCVYAMCTTLSEKKGLR